MSEAEEMNNNESNDDEKIEEITDDQIRDYQVFIDEMVQCTQTVQLKFVAEGNYPDFPESNNVRNQFILSLSAEERAILVEISAEIARGVAHDILFAMEDLQYLITSPNGIELPFRPYYNSMGYDLISRLSGNEWEEYDDSDTESQ